ncbi:MAG: SdpI family protein [Neofamilia sp.]
MKNKIRFTMTSKLSVLISIIIVIIFNVLFYKKMPDMIPVHWNFAGEVDRYADKFNAYVTTPILLVLAGIFMNFMLDNDPKNKTQKNMAITIGKISIPGIIFFIFMIQTIYGLVKEININLITNMLLGVLFIALGNYLPKAKRNYVVGIRVPWTLNSDENWNRTHRLGGIVYIIAGLMFMINVFLNSEFLIFLIIFLFTSPIIYSFYLYTKGI